LGVRELRPQTPYPGGAEGFLPKEYAMVQSTLWREVYHCLLHEWVLLDHLSKKKI